MELLPFLGMLGTEAQMRFLEIWGYWFLFISAFLESFPLGMFIPGQAIVTLSGFFSRLGILNYFASILFFSLGAITGDIATYFIGAKLGNALFKKLGFFLTAKDSNKSQILLNNHLNKFVFISRINPWTRAFLGVICGSAKVEFKKYILSVVWTTFFTSALFASVGYLFGEGYSSLFGEIAKMIFVIVLIFFIIFYGITIIKKYKKEKKK